MRDESDVAESENRAWAVVYRYLKGPRDKDLLAAADALADIQRIGRHKSASAIGRAGGVSGEIVREFLALGRLPDDIRAMFADGELTTLEQGRRLAQLQRHRPPDDV